MVPARRASGIGLRIKRPDTGGEFGILTETVALNGFQRR